jgi:transmembrane sensor
MPDHFITIDELLSDESFINYCKRSCTEDVLFWEAYISNNPDCSGLVEEARTEFLRLFNAMAMSDLEEQVNNLSCRVSSNTQQPVLQLQSDKTKKIKNPLITFFRISAAAAVLSAGLFLALKFTTVTKKAVQNIFVAVNGERKSFQLPDGSLVNLNSGSEIQIDADFGISSRNLRLKGEAFFDVKHNSKLPFIVHTPTMDVQALGTAFNVKAYPGEKLTETALLRGLVEVTLHESNDRKVLLHPNQKILWKNYSPKDVAVDSSLLNQQPGTKKGPDTVLKDIITTNDGEIRETAWKENKLMFEDESFENIAVLLERWYGVSVSVNDETIRQYRFTGLFEKEDLTTVLNILRESKAFSFEIPDEKTVIISSSK